jgi:hypothetical protein
MLANAMSSAGDLIAIAILMDLISQFLIFREIRPGAALLVGPGADLRTVCRSKNLLGIESHGALEITNEGN